MTAHDVKLPLDQYQALRSGGGFVELAGWTSVTIAGHDRQTFLNNFSTNDVKQLAAGDHCELFLTNVKGKIVGHGLVATRRNELVFITVPGQAAAIVAHLDRYVIREDVQLGDTSAERKYLLVAGGGAARKAAEAIADCGLRIADWEPLIRNSQSEIRNWLALGDEFTSLVEARPQEVSRLVAALTAAGAVACGQAAFEAVRIEAGLPLFGVDFNADNLPQEVARNDQAISFTKGCYLGQETVARIDALGHVNQQLAGVQFSGTTVPEVGTQLTHGGAAAGQVTSATYSPRLNAPLALAMLRRGHHSVGSQLDSAVGPGRVISLPVG